MGLDNFYSLRENFIIIGLTGKMQAGADKFVEILKIDQLDHEKIEFLQGFESKYKIISDSESRKARKIKDFFKYSDNWQKFDVIEYKNVILLFILHKCYDNNAGNFSSNICNWITELGEYQPFMTPRFCNEIGIAKVSKEFINNYFK